MAVALVGCVTAWETRIKENRANMLSLKIGMTKGEVVSLMGSPHKNEAYETKTGGVMEYLMYITSADLSHSDWRDSELTPLCIIDGKLKGWGRNYYDDTIKIRKEIIRK